MVRPALWDTKRWAKHDELQFTSFDIDYKRKTMEAEIRSLGEEQKAKKRKQAEVKAEAEAAREAAAAAREEADLQAGLSASLAEASRRATEDAKVNAGSVD